MAHRKWFVAALAACSSAVLVGQTLVTGGTSALPTDHVYRFWFVGDLMAHLPQLEAAKTSAGRYDFDSVFVFLQPWFKTADLRFGNLEFTLAGPPYRGYPMFSGPDAYAEALKKAGFDVLFTSNNHSLDRGAKGLRRTLKVLDSLGIVHTGTFTNDAAFEAERPMVLQVGHLRLALLNPTYGTNGMPVEGKVRIELLDSVLLRKASQTQAWKEADMRLVYVHWGSEYQVKPSSTQKKWASFFKDINTDVVIGSHPHVVQPMEMEREMPVFYSLGNFFSNQRDRGCDGGIVACLFAQKQGAKPLRLSWSYFPVWVWKRMLPTPAYFLLPPDVNENVLRKLGFTQDDSIKRALFFKDTQLRMQGMPLFEP
jgi:hypothetical protein